MYKLKQTLEEHASIHFHGIGLGKAFLDMIPEAQATNQKKKKKIDKLDIRIKKILMLQKTSSGK